MTKKGSDYWKLLVNILYLFTLIRMHGMENFKIQEAMPVVDLISLNSQGDSVVCLLSTLRGEDCV
jgi:hypothetical protein